MKALVRAQTMGLVVAIALISLLIVLGALYVYRTYVNSAAKLAIFTGIKEKPVIKIKYVGFNGTDLFLSAVDEGPTSAYIEAAYLLNGSPKPYPLTVPEEYLGVGNSIPFYLPLSNPSVVSVLDQGRPLTVAFVTSRGVVYASFGPLSDSVYVTVNIPEEFLALNNIYPYELEYDPGSITNVLSLTVDCPPISMSVPFRLVSVQPTQNYVSATLNATVPAFGNCTVEATLDGDWPLAGPMGGFQQYSSTSPGNLYGFAQWTSVSQYGVVVLSPNAPQSLTFTFPQYVATQLPQQLLQSSGPAVAGPFVLDFSWYFYPAIVSYYAFYPSTNVHTSYPSSDYVYEALAKVNEEVINLGAVSVATPGGCSVNTNVSYMMYNETNANGGTALPSGIAVQDVSCGSFTVKVPIYLGSANWVIIPVLGVYDPSGQHYHIFVSLVDNNGNTVAWCEDVGATSAVRSELTSTCNAQISNSGEYYLEIDFSASKGAELVISKVVAIPIVTTDYCVVSGNYLPYDQVVANQYYTYNNEPPAVFNLWQNSWWVSYDDLTIFNNYNSTVSSQPPVDSEVDIFNWWGWPTAVTYVNYTTQGATFWNANYWYPWGYGSTALNGLTLTLTAYTNAKDGVNGTAFIVPYDGVEAPSQYLFNQWYPDTWPSWACNDLFPALFQGYDTPSLYPFVYASFANTKWSSEKGAYTLPSSSAWVNVTISGLHSDDVVLIPVVFLFGQSGPSAAGITVEQSLVGVQVTGGAAYLVLASTPIGSYDPYTSVIPYGELVAVVPNSNTVTVSFLPYEAAAQLGLTGDASCVVAVSIEGIIVSPNYTTKDITGWIAKIDGHPLAVGLNLNAQTLPTFTFVDAYLYSSSSSTPVEQAVLPGGNGVMSFMNLIAPYNMTAYGQYQKLWEYFYDLFPNQNTMPYTLILVGAECPSNAPGG